MKLSLALAFLLASTVDGANRGRRASAPDETNRLLKSGRPMMGKGMKGDPVPPDTIFIGENDPIQGEECQSLKSSYGDTINGGCNEGVVLFATQIELTPDNPVVITGTVGDSKKVFKDNFDSDLYKITEFDTEGGGILEVNFESSDSIELLFILATLAEEDKCGAVKPAYQTILSVVSGDKGFIDLTIDDPTSAGPYYFLVETPESKPANKTCVAYRLEFDFVPDV